MFPKGTATFTQGSKTVSNITMSAGDISAVARGSRLDLGTLSPPANIIEAVDRDISANTITLRDDFNGTTGTYSFIITYTSDGFRDAATAMRDARESLVTLTDTADVNPNPDTFAQRDGNGNVKTGDPLADDDAISKSYLSNKLQLSTRKLINSTNTATTGTILRTVEFETGSGVGAGDWRAAATTGLTPSQTPADRGSAELVDGSGRLWEFAGNALFLEQIGGVLDGVNDNTSVFAAGVSWSDSSGGNLYVGAGTALCGNISLSGVDVRVYGLSIDKSVILTAPNTNTHGVSIESDASVEIKNLTINHDRDNQTGGHAIRLGGSLKTHFDNLRILNADDYAIGVQGGTNLDMEWHNIHIENVGLDGIDLKNYNMDNGIANMSNIRVINHGLDSSQSAGIDVRGKYNLVNAVIKPSAGSYGLRTRPASVQGPAGVINASNIHIEPYTSDTDGIALDLSGDAGKTSISDVTVESMSMLVRLNSLSNGGVISTVSASGIFGTDCMSLDGSDWLFENIKVENTASSSRVFDVEGGNKIRLSNVNLVDNSGNAASARIQAGASNFQVEGGYIEGGSVADSGVSSVVNVTYI